MIITFDTETTGLIDTMAKPLNRQPEIVELHASKLDPETLEEVAVFSSLFKPKRFSEEASQITGITEQMLADAPSFALKADEIADFFLGSTHAAGHNISFDIDMLILELRRLGMEFKFPWPKKNICTVEATESIKGYRLSLSDLHEHLFGQAFDGAHRAKSDVGATNSCLRELVKTEVISL